MASVVLTEAIKSNDLAVCQPFDLLCAIGLTRNVRAPIEWGASKMRLLGFIVMACIAASAANAGEPAVESVSVKGYFLGMPREEAVSLTRSYSGGQEPFTLGGARLKGAARVPSTYFHDGRLDRLYAFFSSTDYDAIERAFLAKYPKAKCSEMDVQTRAGTKATRRDCVAKDSLGTVRIARFDLDLDTATLSMTSDRWFAERREQAASAVTDI